MLKILIHKVFLEYHARAVWVDETGFRTHMTRKRGWSKRGQRLRYTCRRRSSQYTLVCAMGYDGVVAQWVFPKGLDAKRWRTFVLEKLLTALEPGRIVLWDNLKIHQNRELIRALRLAGHWVFFTPPYSPEGNPIEYMFSKLKTFVRKQCPRSAETLRSAIAAGLKTITQHDIASYFLVAWGHVLSW